MSDIEPARGFEDLWRPVARPRRIADRAVLPTLRPAPMAVKARLARIAARAPEVVKVTGRTKGAGHLRAHLEYIARDVALPLEGRDGERPQGREAIRERGDDWAADDVKWRVDGSLSISIVLSMPPGTPAGSSDAANRTLAAKLIDFLKATPPIATRRNDLVRAERARGVERSQADHFGLGADLNR